MIDIISMWAVAYFRRVNQAQRDLEGIVRTYVPRGVRLTRPRNKHRPVESHYPLLGNVVFIEYEPYIHSKVRSVRGYRKFIRIDGKIAVCRMGEVEEIMAAEKRGEFRYDYGGVTEKQPFKVGDRVEILNKATLQGEGVITRIQDGNSVKILIPGWNYELTLDSCNLRHVGV